MHVVQSHAYTIISKYRTFETPLWVYVVSVMGGILTLILITYALYKVSVILFTLRRNNNLYFFAVWIFPEREKGRIEKTCTTKSRTC